eukprot:CAMPEP_0184332852 /NCGR_PEP_ID=MMETSP1089-20130417/1994_1 /TAXON_ID=38269 ORGANISM="Gloeochaete wittrockiana, Strain SAG46.84" /NCGR_SAMPLE_ID=MMETSP1089 /ASSEMBLY_ACC=CAM_ASM_000445 /LENGTH=84 /DNA_ID=CAMNT_0026656425 /DNA_START=266 /DNA_END=520 /DNA_ORIENTATION=-
MSSFITNASVCSNPFRACNSSIRSNQYVFSSREVAAVSSFVANANKKITFSSVLTLEPTSIPSLLVAEIVIALAWNNGGIDTAV